MSGAFDPYLKWLAILPEEQPPNHYRLLGVPLFLDDADVIENAADQRMAHVRNFGAGKHSELSQRILNEISAAKIALLNPEKKAAYDRQLRSTQAAQKKQQAPEPAEQHAERPKLKTRKAEPHAQPASPSPGVARQTANSPSIAVTPRETTTAARVGRHHPKPVWQQPAIMAVGGALLLLVVVGAAMIFGGDAPEVADDETTSTTKVQDAGGTSIRASRKHTETEQQTPNRKSPPDVPKPPVSVQINDPPIAATTPPSGTKETTTKTPALVTAPDESETLVVPNEASATGYALRFEAEDFVELTGSRGAIKLDEPFTVEMWLRLAKAERVFMIFGDHCLGKKPPSDPREGIAGWAWRVQIPKGRYFVGIQYSTSEGSSAASVDMLPSLGEDWHHFALCSTAESARIYIDGKLSKSHPSIVRRIRPSYSSLYLGGMEYTPPFGLQGDIRAFRLSTVDRYPSDFTPPASFEKDDPTITLYDFTKRQAAELTDLAGNHPGRISGAEWIRLAPSSAAEKLETPTASDTPVAGTDSDKKRLPVPDEEALKAKQAIVDELFGEQIKQARSKAAQAEVAQLLLVEARRTQSDPAGRYALFDTALRSAVESGQVDLAMEIVDAVAEGFEVDVLQRKAETLEAVLRNVENNDQRSGVAQVAIELAESAVLAEQFDIAEELSKLVSSAALRVREVELRKASNALRARVRSFKSSWEASQAAIATLKEQPEDADAHLARGKYLALIKQDFSAGLPHLAKGSNTALAKLAQQETAMPESADQRLELADGWYDWAGRASDVEKEGAFARALHWYQNVLPDASTLQAIKVNERIDELTDRVKPVKSSIAQLPWIRGPVGLIREFKGHTKGVGTLDVSADGRYVLTGSQDATIRVWDLATGEEHGFKVSAHGYPVVFTPDGDHVISRDGWGSLSVVDWRTGERKLTYKPGGQPFGLALVPEKPIALIRWIDTTLRGWNYSSGKEEFRFPLPEGTARIALTPDGRRALLGQTQGRVAIYDLAARKVVHQLEPHPNPKYTIEGVAVSRDGRLGLSAAPGSPARVWDLRSGKLLHSLQVNWPGGGDFSPDGRRVVVAGFQNTLDVWDLETKAKLHNLPTPKGRTGFAKFTPDGRGIVSADKVSGVVSLFRIADPE